MQFTQPVNRPGDLAQAYWPSWLDFKTITTTAPREPCGDQEVRHGCNVKKTKAIRSKTRQTHPWYRHSQKILLAIGPCSVFRNARHWSLSWARRHQFTPSNPNSTRLILIISSIWRVNYFLHNIHKLSCTTFGGGNLSQPAATDRPVHTLLSASHSPHYVWVRDL
jgi:hypothetical protein